MDNLIVLLQKAYSGELAAALAYRGHWKSESREVERSRIRQIEEDEWRHRHLVAQMLAALGRRPDRVSEIRAFLVGCLLGLLCRLSGRFLPCYAAGRLERKNIQEYETAARLAAECGRTEFTDCLLTMAEVEWDHEAFFRSCVLSDSFPCRLPLWAAPPAREEIRRSFQQNCRPAKFTGEVS